LSANKEDEFRRFGFFLMGAVAFAGLALLASRAFFAAGPEGEVLTTLKRAEARGLEVSLDAGVLIGTSLNFQRLQVKTDESGGVWVNGTLDFDGTLKNSQRVVKVSSLGLEQIYFPRDRLDEIVELPRLASIVDALRIRESSQPPLGYVNLTHHKFSSQTWYIRSERNRVDVTEEYFLQGDLPDRPLSEHGTKQLALYWTDAGISFETE
jgi:hypothetical protein